MTIGLREIRGRRGENIVENCLTGYSTFSKSLFWPTHLGDKWPSIDFYVELLDVSHRKPFFFVQAKATASPFTVRSQSVKISTKKREIDELLRIPGPTYVFAVHEPSERVFVRSVHTGTPPKAITRIPLTNELTSANLKLLYDEVERFWRTGPHKPGSSIFV